MTERPLADARVGPRMVALDDLVAHPSNSNVMSPELQEKLVRPSRRGHEEVLASVHLGNHPGHDGRSAGLASDCQDGAPAWQAGRQQPRPRPSEQSHPLNQCRLLSSPGCRSIAGFHCTFH
jgi:hypothetical protein